MARSHDDSQRHSNLPTDATAASTTDTPPSVGSTAPSHDGPVPWADLQKHVAAEPNAHRAVDLLLGEVIVHLNRAADDPAAVKQLAADLERDRDALSRAVLAGTPINPEPPHPGPTPNPPEEGR